MADLFESSKLRLSRGKEHILDLEKRIRVFLDTKPYARVIESDSNGVNQEHKIKFTKPLPDEFATIAADAVDNLRSALDHAGYAVSVASGVVDPPNAYFPFANNATNLENVIRGRCKDIPNDIVRLFCSFKPYKGGNDLLWALNRICVANKHYMLAPVGFIVGGMHIIHMTISGTGSIPFPRWDSSKHEIIYAITGPNTRIEYNINLTFDVAFDKVEIVSGQPAIAVLNQLASIVDSILGAIEAEARRLGLI